MPPVTTVRVPVRLAIATLRRLMAIIPMGSGRMARPVTNGEYPRAYWRYWALTQNSANRPKKTAAPQLRQGQVDRVNQRHHHNHTRRHQRGHRPGRRRAYGAGTVDKAGTV